MHCWLRWLSSAVALAGCEFNATGQGTQPGTLLSDGSAGEGVSADGDATAADVTGQPPTSSGDGSAVLEISDGPAHDFGPVAVGASDDHVFTVTNTGEDMATAIAGVTPGGVFSYAGGVFPGEHGTCGNTLPAGMSCDVELRFAPNTLGPHAAALTLSYDGGAEATRPMTGGGAGQSDNLLRNPGGEQGGIPPTSWTDDAPGDWITTQGGPSTSEPFEDGGFIAADLGPDDTDFWLWQDVPVGEWDAEVLRFAFSGQARAYASDDDVFRIRVRYRDGAGTDLAEWDSDWLTSDGWQALGDTRAAPAGTRTIRVQLGCHRNGGTYCDAYYDALELRAVYP